MAERSCGCSRPDTRRDLRSRHCFRSFPWTTRCTDYPQFRNIRSPWSLHRDVPHHQLIFTIFMLAAEKHKGTFLAPVGIGLSLFIAELSGKSS